VLWVELDREVDGLELFHKAKEQGISIIPGIICSSTKKYRNCIRISFGFPWNDKMEKGIITLGQIIDD